MRYESGAVSGQSMQVNVSVFTDRWYRSGKVAYALKGTMPVLALHPTDARSFTFFDDTERLVDKDGILVTTKDDPGPHGKPVRFPHSHGIPTWALGRDEMGWAVHTTSTSKVRRVDFGGCGPPV